MPSSLLNGARTLIADALDGIVARFPFPPPPDPSPHATHYQDAGGVEPDHSNPYGLPYIRYPGSSAGREDLLKELLGLPEYVLWIHKGLELPKYAGIRSELTAELHYHQILLMFGIVVLATSVGSPDDESKQLLQLTTLLHEGRKRLRLSYEQCMQIVHEVKENWKTDQAVEDSLRCILRPNEGLFDLVVYDESARRSFVSPTLNSDYIEAFGPSSAATGMPEVDRNDSIILYSSAGPDSSTEVQAHASFAINPTFLLRYLVHEENEG